eukprot:CAMPEP_0172677536 /NCGR_PEP_ID=MMETSP1074-20121228/14734_1 /TAXON_ID=2916 /ORGANISM="Ceratium fusus, Strain PA161109" /LENGTH=323 /DNA_ID=CAMNT_0013495387 /DNA_START=39 /DNA_END=1010 /DNA_ORIENTATION=-
MSCRVSPRYPREQSHVSQQGVVPLPLGTTFAVPRGTFGPAELQIDSGFMSSLPDCKPGRIISQQELSAALLSHRQQVPLTHRSMNGSICLPSGMPRTLGSARVYSGVAQARSNKPPPGMNLVGQLNHVAVSSTALPCASAPIHSPRIAHRSPMFIQQMRTASVPVCLSAPGCLSRVPVVISRGSSMGGSLVVPAGIREPPLKLGGSLTVPVAPMQRKSSAVSINAYSAQGWGSPDVPVRVVVDPLMGSNQGGGVSQDCARPFHQRHGCREELVREVHSYMKESKQESCLQNELHPPACRKQAAYGTYKINRRANEGEAAKFSD